MKSYNGVYISQITGYPSSTDNSEPATLQNQTLGWDRKLSDSLDTERQIIFWFCNLPFIPLFEGEVGNKNPNLFSEDYPFHVHDDLLPLVQGSPFYIIPNVGEPMDQDEPDLEHTLSQPTAGSSSLANRLDYGEDMFFSCPPVDVQDLRERISYFDSTVPKGTECASTEELTCDLYVDNVE
ncbi:hypothetical protein M422DRAFT_243036 [Sphaerobolus stellatus SS14]|nr:hypothetical protein M422DRAFT_243036 [Sphaerobolus stellatus SS14]